MTMRDKVMDTHCTNEAEPSTALKSKAPDRSSPGFPQPNVLGSEMLLTALATQCLWETDHDRRGKPFTDSSCLELFRRAIVEDDHEARLWVQHCFGGLMGGWLHCHPQREAACHLQSEETYMALAFERFWQASTSNQRLAFNRLAAALQYLHASLHGAIMDTLRANARLREVPLPRPGLADEPYAEDPLESQPLWESIQPLLVNERERRIFYLLYCCGLKPREVVIRCPQEFAEVKEIYRLNINIIERLRRNSDRLRHVLGSDE
jgi:hypothetical protein